MNDTPRIIHFPSHGASNQGFITVAESPNLPFEVKRVYWTYYTPNNIERGGHAHYKLYQLLMAVSGIIDITTENRAGEKETFILNSPDKGLLVPPPYCHTRVPLPMFGVCTSALACIPVLSVLIARLF